MKAMLLCEGLGARIREYSEAIAKPTIPDDNQPMLWRIMRYCSPFVHRDLTRGLHHKESVGKELVLGLRDERYANRYANCIASGEKQPVKLQGLSMDTRRDRQILEDMVEHGRMPWNRRGTPQCRAAAE